MPRLKAGASLSALAHVPAGPVTDRLDTSVRGLVLGRRRRWTVDSMVANRRLAPMSSATISTLDRRSPLVGLPAPLLQATGDQDPAPLVRLRATFSARSLQQTTSRNEVDSSHSLVSLSCHRRLTATDRDVVAWPSRV